jgi:nucleotide-binding universal stress UspA family protein
MKEKGMFKHILVPTDGSLLSRNAAKRAVALAKATGAKITGFHVAPSYKFEVYTDYVPPDFMLPAEYGAKAKKVSERHLEPIRKLAEAAGVPFAGQYAMSDYPADAIVKAVKKYGCDGIVMGSHGRNGIARLLLGSETQKVLVSTRVPVVVTH